jgi:hypothetical protein
MGKTSRNKTAIKPVSSKSNPDFFNQIVTPVAMSLHTIFSYP